MNNPEGHPAGRQNWILLLVALLFLGPLAAAWVHYFYGDVRDSHGGVNYGTLYEPPRPLPALALSVWPGQIAEKPASLRGKWSLVVLEPGSCDEACLGALDKTLRVRLALQDKAQRVQRVFLHSPDAGDAVPEALAPGLLSASLVSAGSDVDLRRTFALEAGETVDLGVFLVDPLGNLVLAYGPGFEMKGMLGDLKRLLKLSRIG